MVISSHTDIRAFSAYSPGYTQKKLPKPCTYVALKTKLVYRKKEIKKKVNRQAETKFTPIKHY